MAPTPDQQSALDLHNQARSQVGVPPLTWDDTLAANATAYAHVLAQTPGQLTHSDGSTRPDQGENLFYASGGGTTFVTATQAWLDEKNNYHGEPIPQGDFERYGHYTQCVWRATTAVGLGMANDANGGTYVVGRYSPEGNFDGQTAY